MGTLTVKAVIDRVATLLTDVTNVRWPRAELLNYLNDGQREIAAIKPNAFVKNVAAVLLPGSRQPLTGLTSYNQQTGAQIANGTTDAISLIDVVRNLSGTTSGTQLDNIVAGRAIRVVSREILDAQLPDWHTSTYASSTIQHYVYSPTDPKTFYVYPPTATPEFQNRPIVVELVYVASPTDAVEGTAPNLGTITLDDVYMTALMDYMMYRAYSKDIEYAENAQYADRAYKSFVSLLSAKVNAENMTNPAHALAPFNPGVPASQK